MCRPVRCDVCGNTTWKGCGQHVDDVRRTVPADQWCDGSHSQAEIDAANNGSKPGIWGKIFGGK